MRLTDPLAAAVVGTTLPTPQPRRVVVTPSTRITELLRRLGHHARTTPLEACAPGSVDVCVLLDDELSDAGDHAEGLVDAAAVALRPGGLLVASARSPWLLGERPGPQSNPDRTFDAQALAALLGARGFAVTERYAPGARSRLTGGPERFDADADRRPGLLDAAPRVVAVARRYAGEAERSATFFASLPRKVLAAACLCRDETGALLVVFDRYKEAWTLPGGVVDADEHPARAAEREAWEEAGIRVHAGAVLGVFAASHPDRIALVYDATPVTPQSPSPVHAHEIAAAEWLPLGDALERLAPRMAERVRRCRDHPGGTWQE